MSKINNKAILLFLHLWMCSFAFSPVVSDSVKAGPSNESNCECWIPSPSFGLQQSRSWKYFDEIFADCAIKEVAACMSELYPTRRFQGSSWNWNDDALCSHACSCQYLGHSTHRCLNPDLHLWRPVEKRPHLEFHDTEMSKSLKISAPVVQNTILVLLVAPSHHTFSQFHSTQPLPIHQRHTTHIFPV